MNKSFLLFLALGLGIVAAYLSLTFTVTKDSHLRLDGKIRNVRIAPLPGSGGATLVVLDVRLSNPTKVQFVTGSAFIQIEPDSGKPVKAETMSKPELDSVIPYLPQIGPRLTDLFGPQDKIAPHQSFDRTLGARIELAEDAITSRKGLVLLLEDVDGAVLEIRDEKAR